MARKQTAADRYTRLYPFVPMDPSDTSYEREWLADGLVQKGKINVLFGMEKAGKSRMLAWMLVRMAGGQDLWNASTERPGRVLYLAGEETRQEVTSRLVLYQEKAGLSASAIDWSGTLEFCEAAGMRLDKMTQRTWLRQRVTEGGFDTLVIDPLRRVHGASESSNDEMSPIYNDLREWTNRHGLTLLLIHHTGKLSIDDDLTRIATWSRGATDLPAVLDWALYAHRLEVGSGDRIRLHRKGRGPREAPLLIRDLGNRFELLKEG